jgi:phosphoribosylformylglycinamidine synthase PurS subunit
VSATEWIAEVVVSLKPVVNDPQGTTVRDSLHRLGYAGVDEVRIGKHIAIRLSAADEPAARAMVEEMSERLLRNPVIEDFHLAALQPRGATV